MSHKVTTMGMISFLVFDGVFYFSSKNLSWMLNFANPLKPKVLLSYDDPCSTTPDGACDGGLEVRDPLKPFRRRPLWGISPLESIKPSLEAAEYLINAQMQDK